MNKIEVDIVIEILSSAIALIETIHPYAASNKIVIEVKSIIAGLKEAGV